MSVPESCAVGKTVAVSTHEDRRPRDWKGLREQMGPLLAVLAAGVVLAFVWRALTPTTARLGDEQEASAAVDGTLALLGLTAGLLTGAGVLMRPGRSPVMRTLAAILGSLLAAIFSWLLGDQLGTPALRAVASAFAWPAATAGVIFLGALLPRTSTRLHVEPPHPRPSRFDDRLADPLGYGFFDEDDGDGRAARGESASVEGRGPSRSADPSDRGGSR